MKGIRERFSCLKITSVGNSELHSGHEKQSYGQTLPAMNLLFFFFIQVTFFPDIEVKTFKACSHTHTCTQEVSPWYGSLINSLPNQQKQPPRDLFKYSKVAHFTFPQAFVTHLPNHPTLFRQSLFTLQLLSWDKGIQALIAVFQAVLGICP